MAALFTVQDVVDDARQVATLLQSRSQEDQDRIGPGLMKGILFKLAKINLSPGDIVSFGVPLSNMPESLGAQLRVALDEKLVSDMLKPDATEKHNCYGIQKMVWFHNYLTSAQWDTLNSTEPSSWIAKVDTLVHLLRSLKCDFLHEQSVKWAVALLVAIGAEKAQSLPAYKTIFQMVCDFKDAFRAHPPTKATVKGLREYPEFPSALPREIFELVYSADQPAVTKEVPRLSQIALNHIPLRKTSKLLEEGNKADAGQASDVKMLVQLVGDMLASSSASSSTGPTLRIRQPLSASAHGRKQLTAEAFQPKQRSPTSQSPSPLALADSTHDDDSQSVAPPESPAGQAAARVSAGPADPAADGVHPAGPASPPRDRSPPADRVDRLPSERYETELFEALMAKAKKDKGNRAAKTAKRPAAAANRVCKRPAAAFDAPDLQELLSGRFSSKESYKSCWHHGMKKRRIDAGDSLEEAKRKASIASKQAGEVWDRWEKE